MGRAVPKDRGQLIYSANSSSVLETVSRGDWNVCVCVGEWGKQWSYPWYWQSCLPLRLLLWLSSRAVCLKPMVPDNEIIEYSIHFCRRTSHRKSALVPACSQKVRLSRHTAMMHSGEGHGRIGRSRARIFTVCGLNGVKKGTGGPVHYFLVPATVLRKFCGHALVRSSRQLKSLPWAVT